MSEDPSADHELVNILVISVDEENSPYHETMWASTVAAHDGGGLFQIRNIGLFAPLAPGDIVRCELNATSRYQVVEIVDPQPVGVGYARTAAPGADDDLVEMIRAAGGDAVVHMPGLVGVVAANPGIFGALQAMTDSGEVTECAVLRDPRIPVDEWGIVLELDNTATSPTGTDYWAGDDPFWSANGHDSADFLARVQMLASTDDRVARALETGRPEQVLRYIERLDAINRGESVEPLTGPIFTED